MPRLDDLTIEELLTTARQEAFALADYLKWGGDEELLIGAYIGSITARITVAEIKVKNRV